MASASSSNNQGRSSVYIVSHKALDSADPTGTARGGVNNPAFEMSDEDSNGQQQRGSNVSLTKVNPKLTKVDPKSPKLKVGPSSLTTVLTVAGAFCVGFMLISSGVILLSTQHNRLQESLRNCGIVFLVTGIVAWIACLILQRKNFLKNVDRLEKELFAAS